MFGRSPLFPNWFFFAALSCSSGYAQNVAWRSEGTFDASTVPQSAVNTFVDATIGGIPIISVDFAHSITPLDGGVLQLNDGNFTVSAANGDTLLGTYTDFQYAPDAESETFTGVGDYTFNGGTGVFEGATGAGSWQAQAEFFPESSTAGRANHDWSGDLSLVRIPIEFEWRSEGTFDASTVPQSAMNTFTDTVFGGVEFTRVDFAHSIVALDGGVLQLNDGNFAVSTASGDTLLGTYTDFRYSPNPEPATDFTGIGNYVFTGGTGIFEGATGAGSWEAEAEFFPESETMGTANHTWTGGLLRAPTEAGLGDCNYDGLLNASDLDCVATLAVRNLVLESLNALPGDLNGDSSVDFDDFLVLLDNFGDESAIRYTQGDINLVGGVEFDDFLLLSSNYQSASGAIAVPEPNGTIMMWLVLFGALLPRTKCGRIRAPYSLPKPSSAVQAATNYLFTWR